MAYFDFTWGTQVEKLLPPILRDRGMIHDGDGDFEVGEIDNNYIEYIVMSHPGHWKEFPVLGVGIHNYLNSNKSPQVLMRAIRVHLEGDIFVKPYINVSNWPSIVINNIMIQLNGA